MICCIYSHQRPVCTSSLSQSSLTSVPACWTRFKSTLYNEDGSKTSTFLTNDSLSFLGKKNMKFWNTWSTIIVQIVFTDAISYNANLLKVEKSWHEEEFNPERIFFLYSNMAAVTSCRNGLWRCVLLLVVPMSNGDCWFCNDDGLKLSVGFFCWIFWFSMPHIVITIERDCLELKNRLSILSS